MKNDKLIFWKILKMIGRKKGEGIRLLILKEF